MELIDTHQHLFYRDRLTYPWLSDFKPLDDDYTLERYLNESGEEKPTGTVFMECDVAESQMGDEARLVYELAKTSPIPILGVIASSRPETAEFEAYLDSIANPLLVGTRRVLHVAPEGTQDAPLFIPNLKALAKRELTFDMCYWAHQLDQAVVLANAVPELQFILDHCGCPKLDGSSDPEWSENMRQLAKLDNVVCKISGLTAYGESSDLTEERLFSTMDSVLDAFGPEKIIWGGDWPVCTVNSSLADWIQYTLKWAGKLSLDEKKAFLSGNAKRVYRLEG